MATSALDPVAAPLAAAWSLSAAEAETLTGGHWHGDTHQVVLRGAALDSRQVRPQALFVCLRGATSDGHAYAAAAAAAGAGLILAGRAVDSTAPVLVVQDVAKALGQLAQAFRRRRSGVTWIGITGSSGKTTVKEMMAAACAAHAPTHATVGNLNNHLGVPVSVLATPEAVRYAVIEMGANHGGEIAALAAIAEPTLGVITGIGPAHLEGFGGIEGVARGKAELFAALPSGATAILGIGGLDMVAARLGVTAARLLAPMREAAAGRHLVLVGSPECPIDGLLDDAGITLTTREGSTRLPLLGGHNLGNAAVAYQAAVAAGVPPQAALAGLAAVRTVPGRLTMRVAGAHRILDDTYNANPASMIAGLQVLANRPGLTLAILGPMGELGAEREHGHRLVGAEAARLGLPLLVVSPAAEAMLDAYREAGGTDGQFAVDHVEALRLAQALLAAGPRSVLVKASRSAGLERLVEALIASTGGSGRC